MVKVKIHTGRGTGTFEVDVSDLTFSGEEFQEVQKLRKEQAGDIDMSTGRGTGTRKLQDIPDPSPKKEKGRIRGRGTVVDESEN
jgi:hypothetical protein|tara:strand:+ start:233 stop:484 length:252 start_codon:yes stop_codon:yes gene_type:complete